MRRGRGEKGGRGRRMGSERKGLVRGERKMGG